MMGKARFAAIEGFGSNPIVTTTKIARIIALIATNGGLIPAPTSVSSAMAKAARQIFISPRMARAITPTIAGSVAYVSSQTICACEFSATYMLKRYAHEPAMRATSSSHGATLRRE